MKPKMVAKISVDIGMTILLIFLMTYELIGQEAHEWLGIGIFVLFVIHHVLNGKWSRNILKGKYNMMRIMQTILAVLVLISMLGSMVSGIVLSRHAFSFLPITGGRSWARTLHMVCAYWRFVLMSLHLGLHWSIMLGMAKKFIKRPSAKRAWILRAAALLIAGYGVYAFISRDIGNYMLLKNQFVFFDFDEPLILFLIDYAAVMGLFIFAGYYISLISKWLGKSKARDKI